MTGNKEMNKQENDIRANLPRHGEAIARLLLGEPIRRSPGSLYFGTKGGSLHVNVDPQSPKQGMWHDFQTGEGGDMIALVRKVKGLDFGQSLGWLAANIPGMALDNGRKGEVVMKKTWKPILPVPGHAPEPDLDSAWLASRLQGRLITARHGYRDGEGRLLGYVIRAESINEDGTKHKETLPLTFCRDERGHTYWRWKGFDEPRPLYGLDLLSRSGPVLVVEGEKTADAARVLFPDMVVVTWSGGAAAAARTDWSPLKGRDVVLWPDHDEAGRKAMDQIAGILSKPENIAASIRKVHIPGTFPPKWDLADPLPENFDPSALPGLVQGAMLMPVSGAEQMMPPVTPDQSRKDQDQLIDVLQALGAFTRDLFGKPVGEDGSSLLFGEGGHLSVTRSGPDRGKWWDTSMKRGGDILTLPFHPLSSRKPEGDVEAWMMKWLDDYRARNPGVKPEDDHRKTMEWVTLERVPEDAPPLYREDGEGRKIFAARFGRHEIRDAYAYRDREGHLLGYRVHGVRRLSGGGFSETMFPVRWCVNGEGKGAWRMAPWPEPRPLHGLDRLFRNGDARVLVVEAEGAAVAAQKRFPDMVVVTWMSGTGEGKTDWSPLKDRDVTIWKSDARKASLIGRILLEQNPEGRVRIVHPPRELGKGWNFDVPVENEPANLQVLLEEALEASRPSGLEKMGALPDSEQLPTDPGLSFGKQHDGAGSVPTTSAPDDRVSPDPVSPVQPRAGSSLGAGQLLASLITLPVTGMTALGRHLGQKMQERRKRQNPESVEQARSSMKDLLAFAMDLRSSPLLMDASRSENRPSGDTQMPAMEHPGLKELEEKIAGTGRNIHSAIAEMLATGISPKPFLEEMERMHRPLHELLEGLYSMDGKSFQEMAKRVFGVIRDIILPCLSGDFLKERVPDPAKRKKGMKGPGF